MHCSLHFIGNQGRGTGSCQPSTYAWSEVPLQATRRSEKHTSLTSHVCRGTKLFLIAQRFQQAPYGRLWLASLAIDSARRLFEFRHVASSETATRRSCGIETTSEAHLGGSTMDTGPIGRKVRYMSTINATYGGPKDRVPKFP